MFRKVNELIPEHLKLTSFSILMARYKGDLDLFIKGAKVINSLKPNDKILIADHVHIMLLKVTLHAKNFLYY